jgi:N-glycosylase/DNA lyase
MTTFTVKTIDYAQRAGLLAYMRKQNLTFEISEPEDEYLYNEMVESEKSGIGDFSKVIEFLQA